jgi:hypothetical protein
MSVAHQACFRLNEPGSACVWSKDNAMLACAAAAKRMASYVCLHFYTIQEAFNERPESRHTSHLHENHETSGLEGTSEDKNTCDKQASRRDFVEALVVKFLRPLIFQTGIKTPSVVLWPPPAGCLPSDEGMLDLFTAALVHCHVAKSKGTTESLLHIQRVNNIASNGGQTEFSQQLTLRGGAGYL